MADHGKKDDHGHGGGGLDMGGKGVQFLAFALGVLILFWVIGYMFNAPWTRSNYDPPGVYGGRNPAGGTTYPGGGSNRQSTSQGGRRIGMDDLRVSNTPCTMSDGSAGVIVRVISTGQTRCGRY